VFNLSGAHRIVVRYCDCPGAPLKHIQLFRARWFPTTIDRPSTAFGFDILDFFHKLENQKKCNQYDFYQAIIQRADVAGLTNPEIVRFSNFSWFIPLIDSPASLRRDFFHPSPLGSSQTRTEWCDKQLFFDRLVV